jgi:hypothetical protein
MLGIKGPLGERRPRGDSVGSSVKLKEIVDIPQVDSRIGKIESLESQSSPNNRDIRRRGVQGDIPPVHLGISPNIPNKCHTPHKHWGFAIGDP